MRYEDCIELYEAVYFFDKIYDRDNRKTQQPINMGLDKELSIDQSIYKAVMRILVANNLLNHEGGNFLLTQEQEEEHDYILENRINCGQTKHYEDMLAKATSESQFFFDRINEVEYEIYSRCNFQVTYQTGKMVANHLDLTNSKVLELGGNSGGLGTALLETYVDVNYTVVDTKIPCMIGNEFKEIHDLDNLLFVEGDVFELVLAKESFDYMILMNLLHDFDDAKCAEILRNCVQYEGDNTKFIIIEDILTEEFEPKEVLIHGLRLSVECKGGRQRTCEEFSKLFSEVGYSLQKVVELNSVHRMLIFQK